MTDNNTKRKNFLRLAQIRTEAILERIRILGNCSNRSTYDYTEEEISKIFSAIDEQLRVVKTKFKKTRRGFKL